MKRVLTFLTALLLASGLHAAELGDDGLHKTAWMRDTFKDLAEDLAEASDEGKRLMLIIEQRGCIYCKKMHEEVFPVPEIASFIEENFFVVQINMFGDIEVTDFDGTALPEKDMVRRWGLLFIPTILFLPEKLPADATAEAAAVAVMPGAFGRLMTFNMLNWVVEKGYDGTESFQKYHARKLQDRQE